MILRPTLSLRRRRPSTTIQRPRIRIAVEPLLAEQRIPQGVDRNRIKLLPPIRLTLPCRALIRRAGRIQPAEEAALAMPLSRAAVADSNLPAVDLPRRWPQRRQMLAEEPTEVAALAPRPISLALKR